MPTDRLQQNFDVGSIVMIVGRVTSIAGTVTQPTVTITTKYANFAGNTVSVGPVDSICVVLGDEVPVSGSA